jgi:hypothetical protein
MIKGKLTMEFKGELTAEVKVIFSEPEKAKAEFIDGDWSSVFWDIENMKDLARDLSFAVHNQPESWVCDKDVNNCHWEKSPEGFGLFIKTGNEWVMDNENTGKITVFIADLEVESIYENKQD